MYINYGLWQPPSKYDVSYFKCTGLKIRTNGLASPPNIGNMQIFPEVRYNNIYVANGLSYEIARSYTNCKMYNIPLKSFNIVNMPTHYVLSNSEIFKNSNIKRIPEGMLFYKVTNCSGLNATFTNCLNIKHITNTSLFKINYSSGITFSDMFANCTSLISIKDEMTLPKNTTVLSNMFNNCTSLINVPINIFSNLEKRTVTTGIDLTNMFNNCLHINGVININALKKLEKTITLTATNAFTGCTNASNYDKPYIDPNTGITYDQIPDKWK